LVKTFVRFGKIKAALGNRFFSFGKINFPLANNFCRSATGMFRQEIACFSFEENGGRSGTLFFDGQKMKAAAKEVVFAAEGNSTY
jgi:hypothetical protein